MPPGIECRVERAGPGAPAECGAILRALPDWFGIESSLVMYARDAGLHPTWLAHVSGATEPAGFITIRQYFAHSADVHCMAVRREFHRHGVGRALLNTAEAWLRERAVKFITVKTQGPSKPCWEYAQTLKFYNGVGFTELEELHGVWPGIPCLLLVKTLN